MTTINVTPTSPETRGMSLSPPLFDLLSVFRSPLLRALSWAVTDEDALFANVVRTQRRFARRTDPSAAAKSAPPLAAFSAGLAAAGAGAGAGDTPPVLEPAASSGSLGGGEESHSSENDCRPRPLPQCSSSPRSHLSERESGPESGFAPADAALLSSAWCCADEEGRKRYIFQGTRCADLPDSECEIVFSDLGHLLDNSFDFLDFSFASWNPMFRFCAAKNR